MRIVITGGPGSGKTTLIEKLRKLRYPIVNESAQIVMDVMSSFLGSVQLQAKWRKDANKAQTAWFQSEILKVSLAQERVIQKLKKTKTASKANELIFFDRGVHDALAYFKKKKITPPEELIKACKKIKYDLILVLETPPKKYFNPKPGRTTTKRNASSEMGKLHFKIYSEYFKQKTQYLPWSNNRIDETLQILNRIKSNI